MKKTIVGAAAAALLLFPGQANACVHTAHVYVMPNEYWDQVAICESSKDGYTADWQDGGRWAGGLGIYIGTWIRYGGRQFAKTPGLATRDEQIVVANRISVVGFTYKSGRYKNPVGYYGWGCIEKRKSLNPKTWKPKARRMSKCQALSVSKADWRQSVPTSSGSSTRR